MLQKVKNGMGSPDCHVSMFDFRLRKLLWVYCPGYAGVKRNDRADRLAGKATITSGLRLGRSEVLRSLRHYLRAHGQGHHTIDRLQERSVEKGGGTLRSSLKGRERAIVSQTNIETASKAFFGKRLRGWAGARIYGLHFRAHTIPLELNRTENNERRDRELESFKLMLTAAPLSSPNTSPPKVCK